MRGGVDVGGLREPSRTRRRPALSPRNSYPPPYYSSLRLSRFSRDSPGHWVRGAGSGSSEDSLAGGSSPQADAQNAPLSVL